MAFSLRVVITGGRMFLSKLQREHMRTIEAASKHAVVSFSMYYAIYVHENLMVHHPIGRAKFLEETIRTKRLEAQRAISIAFKAGKTLTEALMAGGQLILEHTLPITPIDTGDLRRSGRVSLESKRD